MIEVVAATFVTPAGGSISVIFLPPPGGFFKPDRGGGGGGVPLAPPGGWGGGRRPLHAWKCKSYKSELLGSAQAEVRHKQSFNSLSP